MQTVDKCQKSQLFKKETKNLVEDQLIRDIEGFILVHNTLDYDERLTNSSKRGFRILLIRGISVVKDEFLL